ncbi:hypothetical protein C0993_000347 [Termitomyces sp. T159_Od127]|nr:hypothetical protein C0993_000347 [Termitomyces sp. T159_Od127]
MSSAATFNRDTASPAAKKHKRSSSDLSVDELYSLTDGLMSILHKIEEAKGKWRDLEELQSLSDETRSTITQVKIFQNLKKKDPDAMIVSLSHMDEKILRERLVTTPVIRYEGQVTYLAGSADYGILSVLPSEEVAISDERVRKTLLENDNAARALHLFTKRDTFNIYEAKRASTSLKAHESQVIAQCLAIASHHDHLMKKLPFTLTTGAVWLLCSRLGENAERNDPSDQSIQALMTLILIWNTQSGDVIEAAMSSLRK